MTITKGHLVDSVFNQVGFSKAKCTLKHENARTTPVADLKSHRLIYLKGCVFLVILVISIGIVLNETRSWTVAVSLALTVWSAARLYYLTFYVIEKYVDSKYRFSGMLSFLGYLVRKRRM